MEWHDNEPVKMVRFEWKWFAFRRLKSIFFLLLSELPLTALFAYSKYSIHSRKSLTRLLWIGFLLLLFGIVTNLPANYCSEGSNEQKITLKCQVSSYILILELCFYDTTNKKHPKIGKGMALVVFVTSYKGLASTSETDTSLPRKNISSVVSGVSFFSFFWLFC